MPSLHPGYAYDIFISYRQKDNKGDKWVTEFVQALKTELEATIKEDVSIYFDQNPHDGLLESHHVDKSLEGKLKCLLFIPILSQTYCDPKSFAWQHEFCAFNRAAQNDALGRDIRLRNGNVASRILPVRIHDLDAQDQAMVEKETASALRAIDFIYKEPGVNRPLKPGDSRDLNQNKTDYRNQVNKVANAVKELVIALQKPSSHTGTETKDSPQSSPASRVLPLRPWVVATLLTLIAALAIWVYKGGRKAHEIESVSKSIAVLPFADLSQDRDQEYVADGIVEEIINALAQFDSLKVIARTSSFQFRGKNEDIRVIAEKLNVTHLLEGSVRIADDQLRITTKLIHGSTGEEVWSKSYTRNRRDLFATQDEIAVAVASAINIATSHTFKPTDAPKSPQAYDLYLQALFFQNRGSKGDFNRARQYFLESLALDSTQLAPWGYLYGIALTDEERKHYVDMGFRIAPESPEALIMGAMYMADHLEFQQASNMLRKALNQDLNKPKLLRNAALVATQLGNYPQAFKLARRALELDPLQTWSHWQMAAVYQANGEFGKAAEHFRRVHEMTEGNRAFELMEALILNNQLNEAKRLLTDTSFQWYADLLISQKENNTRKSDSLFNVVLKTEDNDQIPFAIARLYAFRGDADMTFRYLDAALKVRDRALSGLLTDPFFIPFRNDPRFLKVRRQLGIPED